MQVKNKDMYIFLSESGLVSRSDLARAYERSEEMGRDIGAILLHDGLLDEREVQKMYGRILGIKFVDLKEKNIPHDVLSLIPEPIARKYSTVSFDEGENHVLVALLNIETFYAIKHLFPKKRLIPHFTDEASIMHALRTYQTRLKDTFGTVIHKEMKGLERLGVGMRGGRPEAAVITHPGVANLIEALVRHAIFSRASDIHIEPRESELFIRYRIGGVLHDAMVLPRFLSGYIPMKLKSLAGLDMDEEGIVQDGMFVMHFEHEDITCRVVSVPTTEGEKVVIKIIKKPATGFSLEGLGFTATDADTVYGHIKKQKGMLLVGGEAHSGITTCLYTILDLMNDGGKSIGTVESPPEYRLGGGINQMAVSERGKLSYADGIRALLKNDTDIIMAGEVASQEVYTELTQAAERDVFVLGGMEGKSALHVLHDLSEKFNAASPRLAPVSLTIATRLLRTLPREKEAYTLNDRELSDLEKRIDSSKVLARLKEDGVIAAHVSSFADISFYKYMGKEGYKGYTGIYEVLEVTDDMREALIARKSMRELEKMVYSGNTMTFLEAGIYKAAQGLVSLEEVFGSEV